VGIRLALGASPRHVTRAFAAHGCILSLTGTACGLAASAAATRVLGASLFGVSPLDPLTYAAVSLGLVAAAVLASAVPALRAMKVDPVEALRSE
jgi:putative ABC transport system permease protein